MNAVIGVRHHQLDALAQGTMEQVEENDGVESAGNGHERPPARQRERLEMRTECVLEIHHPKANPLTRLRDDRCLSNERPPRILRTLALIMGVAAAPEQVRTLSGIYDLIPGLGQPVSVEVGPEDYAAGRSLSELDLRDATDATVLVIVRPDESVILPVGREVLKAGDVLALAGAEEAVQKARAVLRSGPATQSDHQHA
jgi:K+/H+ antiporter YhaU regulatory subunit KhtT